MVRNLSILNQKEKMNNSVGTTYGSPQLLEIWSQFLHENECDTIQPLSESELTMVSPPRLFMTSSYMNGYGAPPEQVSHTLQDKKTQAAFSSQVINGGMDMPEKIQCFSRSGSSSPVRDLDTTLRSGAIAIPSSPKLRVRRCRRSGRKRSSSLPITASQNAFRSVSFRQPSSEDSENDTSL